MAFNTPENITQREIVEFEQTKEMFDKQAGLQIRLKELEIEALKLESKITAWFTLPVKIIKLPVYLLFGVGYIIHSVKKTEPSESFWKFLK